MTKEKQDLIDYLVENISTENYDQLCEIYRKENKKEITRTDIVKNYIKDFLSDLENYDISLDKENWNEDNANEIISEITDNDVHIYYSDLWDYAPVFQWDIEEAIREYGFPEDNSIIKILQQGEYFFYKNLYSEFTSLISNFFQK